MIKSFEREAIVFFQDIMSELKSLEINFAQMNLSHLAFRTKSTADYIKFRGQLELHASANIENYWNGRPISKILLKKPLHLADECKVQLIELIPPPHQRVYPLGFEHIGIVLGDQLQSFVRQYQPLLTGQQFQSSVCNPYYIRFDDYRHVKFYKYSLQHVCELEGRVFDRIEHVEESVYGIHDQPYPLTASYLSPESYYE
jgi:predicted metalloenzyme YecM